MKKICVLIILVLLPVSVYAQGIPFSETVELKTFEDHYTIEKVISVYVKEGQSYTQQNRVVSVNIAPQDYLTYQGAEMKDYFVDILVSVVIATEDGKVSKDFVSYLNFEPSSGRLFWDHAGNARADRAGETMGQNAPLVVEDEALKITLTLLQMTPSEYLCSGCQTDASSYLGFIDLIRWKVDIVYTQSQLDILAYYGDATQYVTSAQAYFGQGEFEKAKEEFENAKNAFDDMGDTTNSAEMQEWIDKCVSYQAATDNFKEGMKAFEEAATISAYQSAIDKYEEAKAYFTRAKTEFDLAEDKTKSDECQAWIDKCDDEIENLQGVGTLRGRLIYIIIGVVVIGAAGMLLKQVGKGKGKPEAPRPKGMTLRVQNAVTGQEVSVQVEATDKIGKVRQLAATSLGIVPSALLHNGKVCSPDRSVGECGLRNGDVVEVVPQTPQTPQKAEKTETYADKLERIEQLYREGKITKDLYENLKRNLEK